MLAYPVTQFGLDHLQLTDLPEPRIAPDMGQIVAVGEGVTRVEIGDRVCGIFMQRWLDGPLTADKSMGALGGDVDGMLAEYVLLHQDGVVRFPEHLSYEEAATLPCAGVTAWNALHYGGDPASPAEPGETVLIQGTGGVSIFALQFARLMGAKVIGTSSSDVKLARAYSLGLSVGCNYRDRPDWSKWVAEVTHGTGADRIIEVGGATTEPLSLAPILHNQLRVQGIYVGSRAMFEQMNAAIAKAELRPVIDHIFPVDQAREAFLHMQSGSHFGKIVIRVAEA